jgi:hypothetical protein
MTQPAARTAQLLPAFAGCRGPGTPDAQFRGARRSFLQRPKALPHSRDRVPRRGSTRPGPPHDHQVVRGQRRPPYGLVVWRGGDVPGRVSLHDCARGSGGPTPEAPQYEGPELKTDAIEQRSASAAARQANVLQTDNVHGQSRSRTTAIHDRYTATDSSVSRPLRVLTSRTASVKESITTIVHAVLPHTALRHRSPQACTG